VAVTLGFYTSSLRGGWSHKEIVEWLRKNEREEYGSFIDSSLADGHSHEKIGRFIERELGAKESGKTFRQALARETAPLLKVAPGAGGLAQALIPQVASQVKRVVTGLATGKPPKPPAPPTAEMVQKLPVEAGKAITSMQMFAPGGLPVEVIRQVLPDPPKTQPERLKERTEWEESHGTPADLLGVGGLALERGARGFGTQAAYGAAGLVDGLVHPRSFMEHYLPHAEAGRERVAAFPRMEDIRDLTPAEAAIDVVGEAAGGLGAMMLLLYLTRGLSGAAAPWAEPVIQRIPGGAKALEAILPVARAGRTAVRQTIGRPLSTLLSRTGTGLAEGAALGAVIAADDPKVIGENALLFGVLRGTGAIPKAWEQRHWINYLKNAEKYQWKGVKDAWNEALKTGAFEFPDGKNVVYRTDTPAQQAAVNAFMREARVLRGAHEMGAEFDVRLPGRKIETPPEIWAKQPAARGLLPGRAGEKPVTEPSPAMRAAQAHFGPGERVQYGIPEPVEAVPSAPALPRVRSRPGRAPTPSAPEVTPAVRPPEGPQDAGQWWDAIGREQKKTILREMGLQRTNPVAYANLPEAAQARVAEHYNELTREAAGEGAGEANPHYDPAVLSLQTSTVERLPKRMENRAVGQKIENAGDIVRELSGVKQPASTYIREKIGRIEAELGHPEELTMVLSVEDAATARAIVVGYRKLGFSGPAAEPTLGLIDALARQDVPAAHKAVKQLRDVLGYEAPGAPVTGATPPPRAEVPLSAERPREPVPGAPAPPSVGAVRPAEGVTGPEVVEPPKHGEPWTGSAYRGEGPKGPVDEGLYGKGTYLSQNRGYAYRMQEKSGGEGPPSVYQVSLKKPYVSETGVEVSRLGDTARLAAKARGESAGEQNEAASRAIRDHLEAEGYDGIIVGTTPRSGASEIVVFDPRASLASPGPATEPAPTPAREVVEPPQALEPAPAPYHGMMLVPNSSRLIMERHGRSYWDKEQNHLVFTPRSPKRFRKSGEYRQLVKDLEVAGFMVTYSPRQIFARPPGPPIVTPSEQEPTIEAAGVVPDKVIHPEIPSYLKSPIQRVIDALETRLEVNTLPSRADELRKAVTEDTGLRVTDAEQPGKGEINTDDLHDALEGAINRTWRKARDSDAPLRDRIMLAVEMEQRLGNRPRTLGMRARQQFSTPLPIAEATAAAGGVRQGEVVLEPTAGTGNLIEPLRDSGARVQANELEPRRVEVLKDLGWDVTSEDALGMQTPADVILMNPPWGAIFTGKYRMAMPLPYKPVDVSQRFFHWALQHQLREDGRIVMVAPTNLAGPQAAPFRAWLRKNHTLRAIIESPPGAYDTRGTTVGSILIVVDKGKLAGEVEPLVRVGENAPKTWEEYADVVGELIQGGRLERVAPRAEAGYTGEGRPSDVRAGAGERAGPAPEGAIEPRGAAPPRPSGGARDVTAAGAGRGGDRGPTGLEGEGARPDLVPKQEPGGGGVVGRPEGEAVPRRPRVGPRRLDPALLEQLERDRTSARSSEVFAPFESRFGDGRNPHPRLVVEARTLAGAPAPELTVTPHPDAMRAYEAGLVSDEQMDAYLGAKQANEEGHGMLVADDVGVGKTREAALLVLDWIRTGEETGKPQRILYTTRGQNNISDMEDEFDLVFSRDPTGKTKNPVPIIRVSDYKQASSRSKKEYEPLPVIDNAIYVVDSFNIAPYLKALRDVGLTGMVGDEAHLFKNKDRQKGIAWTQLHRDLLAKKGNKFAYFTATPAEMVEDLEYMYGLREWQPGGFSDWLAGATGIGDRPPTAAGDTSSDITDLVGTESDDTMGTTDSARVRDVSERARVTPAEIEQIMRELKMRGKYMSRDLWRGGVEFAVKTLEMAPETIKRYDTRVGFMRDVLRKYLFYRTFNKAAKDTYGIRSLLQFEAKRALFDLRLDEAVQEAKDSLAQGEAPVISLLYVHATSTETGMLPACINKLNTRDMDVIDGEVFDNGEIPEALIVRAELLERLPDEAPPFRDPIEVFQEAFGKENVAVVTGDESAAKRKVAISAFQEGRRKLAIISGAGQTGISLHHVLELTEGAKGRRHLIVCDLQWRSSAFKQGLGRVDRAGQVSAPKITYLSTGSAAESRFTSGIANRLRTLGATSKGAAEATGTEAMEMFEIGGGLDNAAMRLAWERGIITEQDKQLFAQRPYHNTYAGAGYGQEEYVPEFDAPPIFRPGPDADVASFMRNLQLLPWAASDRAMGAFFKVRDELRESAGETERQEKITAHTQGEVLRRTKLDPLTTLYEVQDTAGHKFGMIQGVVTPHMKAIREATRTTMGEYTPRQYGRFRAGEENISGLMVAWTQIPRVARVFGKAMERKITPANALENLRAGEKISVRGHRGVPWELRWSHSASATGIRIGEAKMADRQHLLQYGAKYHSIGNWWELPEERLEDFLERFPLQQKTETALEAAGRQIAEETDVPPPAAGLSIQFIRGARGKRPLVPARPQVAPPDIQAAVEEAMKGVQEPGIVEKTIEIMQTFWHRSTRTYRDLPRGERYAQAHYELTRLPNRKANAGMEAVVRQKHITLGFEQGDLYLFTWKVLVDDLAAELEQNPDVALPFFGRDVEAFQETKTLVDAEVEKYPKFQEALPKRSRHWREVKERVVSAYGRLGVDIADKFRKVDYYRHQVLEYAEAEQKRIGGGKRLHVPMAESFMRRREGSAKAINMNYFQAEFDVMARMLADAEIADTLLEIGKVHNARSQMRRQAAKLNDELVMERVFKPLADSINSSPGRPPNAKPVTPESLYRQTLNRKQAIGWQRLQDNIADIEDLPARFEEVVADLMERAEAKRDAILEGEVEEGFETGGPTTQVAEGSFSRNIFGLLNWLARAQPNTPAGMAARLIFKGMAEKREYLENALGSAYRTWRNVIPRTHRAWQPREGVQFFSIQAIPEDVMRTMLDTELGELVGKNKLRQVMAKGQRFREWVIPVELADTMDDVLAPGKDSDYWEWLAKAQRMWKQYVLLNPRRAVGYNARNATGDVEPVFRAAPAAFRKLPQAFQQLWEVFRVERAPTDPDLAFFMRETGVGGLLQAQEIGDLDQIATFRQMLPRFEKGTINLDLVKRYWWVMRRATDFRESLLRYSVYLHFLEKMRAGDGRPPNFGASIPEEVLAIPDERKRAIKLSNELLGAYDQITETGRWNRKYLKPFWSWQEINASREIRLWRNAFAREDVALALGRNLAAVGVRVPFRVAKRLAWIAGGTMLIAAITQMWNLLFYSDEEDDLPEWAKSRPHLILGRNEDGAVRYLGRLGAVSDILEWFGLEDFQQEAKALLDGEKTLLDLAKEAAKAVVQKEVDIIAPWMKIGSEVVMGRSTFPDWTQPRRIDRWDYLAQQLSARPESRLLREGDFRQYAEEAVTSLTGATTARPATRAQTLMGGILGGQVPERGMTGEQRQRSRVVREATDLAREGKESEFTTLLLKRKRLLRETDLQRIVREAAIPAELAQFKRLGVQDAWRVWRVATDEERAMFSEAFMEKIANAVDRGTLSEDQLEALFREIGMWTAREQQRKERKPSTPAQRRRDRVAAAG